MYELVRAVAGVRQKGLAWEEVEICPHLEYLPDLEGDAITPKGNIHFHYRQEAGEWHYEVNIPEGLKAVFIGRNGQKIVLNAGQNRLKVLPEKVK